MSSGGAQELRMGGLSQGHAGLEPRESALECVVPVLTVS